MMFAGRAGAASPWGNCGSVYRMQWVKARVACYRVITVAQLHGRDTCWKLLELYGNKSLVLEVVKKKQYLRKSSMSWVF